jgi:hypothetical protein
MPGKLIKQIKKLLKNRRGNPNVIDGKDVTQTRFRGVNRTGEGVVKKGMHGKVKTSYFQGLKNSRNKLQDKIWKEDLYKNMYQKTGSKNKKFGGAVGPNGVL